MQSKISQIKDLFEHRQTNRNMERVARGQQLQYLKVINFLGTKISDSHLRSLCGAQSFRGVQELILRQCRNVTDEGVALLCRSENFDRLLLLDLGENLQLTALSLEHLGTRKRFLNLQELKISGSNALDDRAIKQLLETHA
jgi:hypothetical protein